VFLLTIHNKKSREVRMNNYKRAIPIYLGVVLAILFTACESNSTSLMSGLSQDAEMNDPTSTPTLSLQ
jgi:hypothetical protein